MTKANSAKRPLWAIALLFPIALALFLMLTSLQRALLFPRVGLPQDEQALLVAGAERLTVDVPRGEVEAYFLPGDGVSAARPGPAVVFAHGNGELVDYWPRALERYRRLGVSVLLPEYRGYGRSAGAPSEQGITDDFVRFYDQLVARDEVDASRIVFHGRSLGGGAVCALARRRPPAAFILMSTFTSVEAIARSWRLPGFLVRDKFRNDEVIAASGVPVLIAHGTRDRVIPFKHAGHLARASGNARVISFDAGHNDCPTDWNRMFDAIEEHLHAARIL